MRLSLALQALGDSRRFLPPSCYQYSEDAVSDANPSFLKVVVSGASSESLDLPSLSSRLPRSAYGLWSRKPCLIAGISVRYPQPSTSRRTQPAVNRQRECRLRRRRTRNSTGGGRFGLSSADFVSYFAGLSFGWFLWPSLNEKLLAHYETD